MNDLTHPPEHQYAGVNPVLLVLLVTESALKLYKMFYKWVNQ